MMRGVSSVRPSSVALSSAEFRAVIGMVLFIMLGFGLILPTLPLFAKSFKVGESAVGVLITAFAATRLAGDLVAGSLIDRHGERIMAMVGVAIVGVSSLAAGAAPGFGWLVAFRGAGGVGSAFFLGALTAYVLGAVDPDHRGRAVSLFQAAIGLGITLGPVFGGVLGTWSLRAPLYVYGAVCLIAAPIALVVMRTRAISASALSEAPAMPPDCPPPARPPALKRLRPLLSDSAYRAALMGSASDFWVTSALLTLASLVWVGEMGLSKSSAGVPLTVLGLAALAVIWHAGSLSDRRGRKVTLVPALGVTTVALVLMGFATHRFAFLALMGVLGVASGYSRPGATSIVADVASADQRAVAVAGSRTAADIGAMLAPIVVGVIAEGFGFRWAFLATASLSFAAFLVAAAARESLPRQQRAGATTSV